MQSFHKRRPKVKLWQIFLPIIQFQEVQKLYDNLPDEIAEVNVTHISSEEQVWQLFFDRASTAGPEGNVIAGVGVVLHIYMIDSSCILINWAVFQ